MDHVEDEELRLEISQLEERVAQARQEASLRQQPPHQDGANPSYTHTRGRGAGGYPGGRGRGYSPARYSPYSHRGRGHHVPSVTRNRTVVFNQQSAGKNSEAKGEDGTAWVSKQTPFHKQLINRDVFMQNAEERTKAAAEAVARRKKERNEKEQRRLQSYLHHTTGSGTSSSSTRTQEIEINGIPFRVANDGSKLIRMTQNAHQTPKSTKVAGVQFIRSKNGNLYRSGLIRTKKYILYVGCWTPLMLARMQEVKKSNKLCPHFTTAGWCTSGTACRYVHDPNKVAICKEFLQKGTCPRGSECDLSHDPNPHRVPACSYFLRGNCTNDNCRYAHVNVNPAAHVCRSFGLLGYCEDGASCLERHVFECPDFANTGTCRRKDCRLPHIERASTMRKLVKAADGGEDGEGKFSDISSDEECEAIDSDDIDSDDLDDGMSDGSHAFSQQRDFIKV